MRPELAGIDPLLKEGIDMLKDGSAVFGNLLSPRYGEVLFTLQKYIEEIELFNPAYGLVGVRDRAELIVKHILDSLAPLAAAGFMDAVIKGGENSGRTGTPAAADVGSGAGLPGIPLAIMLPGIHFTLMERMGRRAGFLRNSLAVLGLDNAEAEERDMEKAAPGRFSLIVFRAFRPLEPPIIKGLFRLLAPGGILAAYKGKKEKIGGEMAALGGLAGTWEALPVQVPFLDEERHIVLIRRSTP
ncbi:16S rRNA (guanine(527)-N(7))-methyltransferase RsmG [Treponema sp. OttesenSCG-928-L16]|nr:16S rRNA (guanine(527)-N(7))-methyltransferase RsmG [Treponema sp. OttesenSCG-928-L16]